MTPSIAIHLSGTLGERHRRLNAFVHDAYQQNTSFQSIQNQPEVSPTHRLFKIDLASKQRNVDYIIHTLKDDDMLYVSRALKSLWLLETEYSEIINPSFLEGELFTQMTLQAANKTRHWIQLNLRDPQRCEEFYLFYKGRNFDTAVKFLWHCSREFILNEFTNILENISPRLLKMLSEKVPELTKIYYDHVRENEIRLKHYRGKDKEYFANIKYLLKPDPDVFFYILENYFEHENFRRLSPGMTKYIMKHHKTRFMEKPELYTMWFLEVNALAEYLSSDEIKELVLKLANAKYLRYDFSYRVVEPLIKRLSEEESTAFKKIVFVDKAFGPPVEDWPYPIPDPPFPRQKEKNCFSDARMKVDDSLFFVHCDYDDFNNHMESRKGSIETVSYQSELKLKRQKRAKRGNVKQMLAGLFEQFRFSNYDESLLELQKLLRAESSAQIRRCMLLVLVSKTGGRAEELVSFLELLSQFRNEPVHIRAAIVRSLVKQAFVWRLSPEYWAKLLQWGHGLGLDGSVPEAACLEGLHAVVARDLIAGVTLQDSVWKAFLKNFTTFTEYSFSGKERGCLRARLPLLLLADAQLNADETLNRLKLLLDTLEAYNFRFDKFPGTIEAIAAATERNFESAKHLLSRVYKAGVGRKLLVKENFKMLQTDASYVNALRHDLTILDTAKFEELIDKKKLNKHERFLHYWEKDGLRELNDKKKYKLENFLRKLAVYFTEKDGLGERYRAILQLRAATTHNITLARPLALLAGSSFPSLLKDFDAAPPKTPQRQLAAALRSNAEVVRPIFDLDSFGWRDAGAKAVANRVVTCRPKDVERYLTEILSWHHVSRLAFVLARRVSKERDVFEVFASKRPSTAFIKCLLNIRRKKDNSDLGIWDMVKTHILKFNKDQLSRVMRHVRPVIESGKSKRFLADFCVVVYKACKQNLPNMKIAILFEISAFLPEVDSQFIYEELDDFLRNYFKDSAKKADFLETIGSSTTTDVCLYISIIAKFLVLSESEEIMKERIQKIGVPFLKYLKLMWRRASGKQVIFVEYFLDKFLLHLRYNQVFFDVKYVSCLPVFEVVTEWMHSYLPMEIWYGKYVSVHLTMIYFKTIRVCLNQNPKLFSEEIEERRSEVLHSLGTSFGKFLSYEIEELARKYFPSITKLYGAQLVNYFNKYFGNGITFSEFTASVIRELLKNKSEASRGLAKYLFTEFNSSGFIRNDILKALEEIENKEIRFGLIKFD